VRAAVLLALLFTLALGACSGDTLTPDRAGAQATLTLTRTPARSAAQTSASTPTRRMAITPTRTPKRKATVTATLTPASSAAIAPTSTATRRATATPMVVLSGLPTIPYDRLPAQARDTIALIQRGGPFPYRQDGAVFQNRERLLPGRPKGYYQEYTVETPGSPDRGARRIVAGNEGELYYTDDHYDSFKQVVMP
jgi:ribonuclease T1